MEKLRKIQVPYSTGRKLPSIEVPEDSCDCHHHIYDPVNFPYREDDITNIPPATVDVYLMLQRKLGFNRSIIVTPSAYGTDNRCTLDALEKLGRHSRAVVTIDDSVEVAELEKMNKLGVRGIRFNIAKEEDLDIELIKRCAKKIEGFGWHICFWMPADLIVCMKDVFRELPCNIVFDHRGHLPADKGMKHEAFKIICSLMREKKAWVKISSAYQDSAVGEPEFSDTIEIGREYIRCAKDRVLWGTDWPHPSEYINRRPMPNDVLLLDLLEKQAETKEVIQEILVANPEKLYGFQKK